MAGSRSAPDDRNQWVAEPAGMIEVTWLGRLPQPEVAAAMERRRLRILEGQAAEVVWLCEHPPVITLGRSASEADVLASAAELAAAGVTISRTRRGGDVTFHGPGQLMVYPIVRLERGLLAHLRAIAAALAEVAAHYGVLGAQFRRDRPGLWHEGDKLAACGVHVSRRVSIHGFAFNVATPPSMWNLIVPCGQSNRAITSLAERIRGAAPTVADVAAIAAPILGAALKTGGEDRVAASDALR